MICTVPYIRDPKTPRCPGCGAQVYVQADQGEETVKIGKQEIKRATYKVKDSPDLEAPLVMSACKCRWLLDEVNKLKSMVINAPIATGEFVPSIADLP